MADTGACCCSAFTRSSVAVLHNMSHFVPFVISFSMRSAKPSCCHSVYWNSRIQNREIDCSEHEGCVFRTPPFLSLTGWFTTLWEKVLQRQLYLKRSLLSITTNQSTLMHLLHTAFPVIREFKEKFPDSQNCCLQSPEFPPKKQMAKAVAVLYRTGEFAYFFCRTYSFSYRAFWNGMGLCPQPLCICTLYDFILV